MKHVKRFNTVSEAMETAANGLPSPHLSYIESTEKVCFATTNSSTLQCGFDENGISSSIPENNTTDEIWYISYDGSVVTPWTTTGFTQSIVSNTYTNGLGVIKFNAPLTKIGRFAFLERTNLKLVSLPTALTSIDEGAFDQSGIQALKIPEGPTALTQSMCLGCDELRSVSIPSSVTTAPGHQIFESCDNLRYVEIKEGLTNLPSRFINGASHIEKLIIPTSVTTISSISWWYKAFGTMPTDFIYYKGTIAQWNAIDIDLYNWLQDTTFTIHCSDGDTTVSVFNGIGGWEE